MKFVGDGVLDVPDAPQVHNQVKNANLNLSYLFRLPLEGAKHRSAAGGG